MNSRSFSALGIIVLLGVFLASAAYDTPGFNAGNSYTGEYYLENSLKDTGSANVVNAIVWDFRGYDTLGEETVLFTAALAVILIAGSSGRKGKFSLKKMKRTLGRVKS